MCFSGTRDRPVVAPLPLLLGDASYSIYLVHMGTALAAFQAWRHVDALHNPAGIVASMIVTALVSVGAGVFVYWFVERPIIKHFKVPTPKSRPLVAGSSLAADAAIQRAGQVDAYEPATATRITGPSCPGRSKRR